MLPEIFCVICAGGSVTMSEVPAASNATEAPEDFVRALHAVRFPLHDHCRKNLHWSNAQVLMRFVLIQAFMTPMLFVLLIKIR